MNSKLLKLEPPFNIIYAGGLIGRHIATLLTWEEPQDEDVLLPFTAGYPVIDQGDLTPSGTLVGQALVEDCRIVCREDKPTTDLRSFAQIVKYDSQQPTPSEAGYLWERLTKLGVSMIFDREQGSDAWKTDYEVTLYFMGSFDRFTVESNESNGFWFSAKGSAEDVYQQLSYQRDIYIAMFYPQEISFRFVADGIWEEEEKILDRLNQVTEP